MASSSSREKLDDALTRLAVKKLRFKRRTPPSQLLPVPDTAVPTADRSVPAMRHVGHVTHALCSPSSPPHNHQWSPLLSPLQVTPPPPENTPPPLPLSMRTPPSPIYLSLSGPRSGPPSLPAVLRVNRYTPGMFTS